MKARLPWNCRVCAADNRWPSLWSAPATMDELCDWHQKQLKESQDGLARIVVPDNAAELFFAQKTPEGMRRKRLPRRALGIKT